MFRKIRNKRHNYIRNCNKHEAKKYFEELKKNSKKDPSLIPIFQEDKAFYISLHKNVQKGGFFGTGATKKTNTNMCDKITNNMNCNERRMVLAKILKLLRFNATFPKQEKDWKDSVQTFIEYLVCCYDSYTTPPNYEYKQYILKILTLISNNKEMTLHAQDVLKYILLSEKELQGNAFLVGLIDHFDKMRVDQSLPVQLQDINMEGGSPIGLFRNELTNNNTTIEEIKDKLDLFVEYLQEYKDDGDSQILNEMIDLIKNNDELNNYAKFVAKCSLKMENDNEYLRRLCQ